jgi:hypothetical protein
MTKNKKTVALMGGLGNQMFQYAFGQALCKKFGCDILYDTTWFVTSKKDIVSQNLNKAGMCIRDYELNVFPLLKLNVANENDIILCRGRKSRLPGFIRNLLKYPKFISELREKNMSEYSEHFWLLAEKKNYFSGYFQKEEYFKEIREDLLKDFSFPAFNESETYNKDLLNRIKNCKNSVFVHIRRGDYVALNMNLPDSYYKNALKIIHEKVENPYYFVFCEQSEVDYVKEHFDFGNNYEIVGNNEKKRTSIEDMHLMSECKNAIIANSSFSWWAAWLSLNSDKVIVAPENYSNICKNWIACQI